LGSSDGKRGNEGGGGNKGKGIAVFHGWLGVIMARGCRWEAKMEKEHGHPARGWKNSGRMPVLHY
jgi:hypothetical protein